MGTPLGSIYTPYEVDVTLENADGRTATVRGIELAAYTPVKTTWQLASEHPPNADYYMFGPANGFINFSSVEEAPIFISQPHFFGVTDREILGSVSGLNPTASEHEFRLLVEPWSGKVMGGGAKSQINVQLAPLSVANALPVGSHDVVAKLDCLILGDLVTNGV